jgi:hypothetical protein
MKCSRPTWFPLVPYLKPKQRLPHGTRRLYETETISYPKNVMSIFVLRTIPPSFH